jgi:hypothetical protein
MATTIDVTGVAEDALNLKQMLEGVLDRVETVFQSYNVTLPSRRYWAMGTPPVDCDQVVVSFVQMYLGAPGAQVSAPQRCNVPRSATINISISRELPVVGQNGRPPSPDKLEYAASVSAIDAWVLMQSINLLDQWDESGYGVGVIATLESPEPEGGFQTVALQITMAVP